MDTKIMMLCQLELEILSKLDFSVGHLKNMAETHIAPHFKRYLSHYKGDLDQYRSEHSDFKSYLSHYKSYLSHQRSDHINFKCDLSHWKNYIGHWRSDHSHFKSYLSHYKGDFGH